MIMAYSRNKGEHENYGAKLFYEGVQHKQEKERRIMIQKRLEEANQEPEAKFQPNISEVTRNINRGAGDVVERLHEAMHKSQTARQRLAEQFEQEENKECTFNPRLNRRSEVLSMEKTLSRKRSNKELFEVLHMEAEEREKKRILDQELALNAVAPFRPTINKSSAQIMQERKGYENHESLVERLISTKVERDKYVEMLRSQYEPPFDPTTGQEWFRPRISRLPPNISTSRKFRPDYTRVHEDLFNESRLRDIQRQQEILNETSQPLDKIYTSEHSQLLVEQIREKKLLELFNFFDTDNDGFIYISHVESDVVEPYLAEHLTAIIGHFQDNNREFISCKDFISAMTERLEMTKHSGPPTTAALTTIAKNKITRSSAEYVDYEAAKCTFKPQINPTSEEIAMRVNSKRFGRDQLTDINRTMAMHSPNGETNVVGTHPLTSLEVLQHLQERDEPVLSGSMSYASRSKPRKTHADYLIEERERRNHRIRELVEEKEREEINRCTFHPNINNNINVPSRVAQLVKGTAPSAAQNQSVLKLSPDSIQKVTERLSQSKRRPTNNELITTEDREIEEHCTFTPNIKSRIASTSRLNMSVTDTAPSPAHNSSLSTSYLDTMTKKRQFSQTRSGDDQGMESSVTLQALQAISIES